MEKSPQFIKKFSKEESLEERQLAAQTIRVKRKEYFTEKYAPTEQQNELQPITGEREQILAEQLEAIGNLENAITKLSTSKPALQEAKTILENFYLEQKWKWEESGYAREDITKYFSEGNLTSLPLEDYALLLKRFPSEMVTHVTRQGGKGSCWTFIPYRRRRRL